MQLHLRFFSLTLTFLLLTGCAAPVVRTAEADRSIKSVAVVSLLNEQTQVERIGLTVFNNQAVLVDQTGVLNQLAAGVVEDRIRNARPGWQVKNARPDAAGMMSAKNAAGRSWTSQVSAYSADLAALAKKLDVDMLFVVVDHSMENRPGRGVGIRLRTLSLSSVRDATIHAVNLVVLVDREGKEITNRWGGESAFATLPASEVGLDYDMSQVSNPETQKKLKALMQDRLKASLGAAASAMGY